jgi:hypothetical protein
MSVVKSEVLYKLNQLERTNLAGISHYNCAKIELMVQNVKHNLATKNVLGALNILNQVFSIIAQSSSSNERND